MKTQKANLVNSLNQKFYKQIANHFHSSRSHSWDGWFSVWDFLESNLLIYLNSKKSDLVQDERKKLSILDIGCGNGRFYSFLKEKFVEDFNYLGVDSDLDLLNYASQNYPEIDFKLVDIFDKDWKIPTTKFDIIALFGVMHHLPDLETREKLFKKIAELLKNNGIFVCTTWNFDQYCSQSILDLDLEIAQKTLLEFDLKKADFQTGDFLLDWKRGETAVRFAHSYDTAEMEILIKNTNFKLLKTFVADGSEKKVNTYWIYQNQI
jgi:SAM-dependent methyltransferase